MDKCSKEFPPEIKARWDALAGKGLPSDKLEAFEKYLFGKDAAKPEQVAAFVELMQQIPVNEKPPEGEKTISAHLFDELYKKYHHAKGERETVHAITKSLLQAQHGEAMKFIAENHLSIGNPAVPKLVDKAIEDGCREVLVKPKEHAKLTEQSLKSATRRHLLHEINTRMTEGVHVSGDSAVKFSTTAPTILVKTTSAEPDSEPHPVAKKPAASLLPHAKLADHNGLPHPVLPVVKKEVHGVLPHTKLLAHKARAAGATKVTGTQATPVQEELFNGEAHAASIRPITPKSAQPKAHTNGASSASAGHHTPHSFSFVISGGAAKFVADTSDIEKLAANPIPVTAYEKEKAERKRIKEKKKADYEAGGGFMGMVGRAVTAPFADRVKEERTQEPNVGDNDMARGK